MRRLHRLSFLSILIGRFGPVFAQVSYPNCSAGWEWSYNSLHQNPCNIAASLEGWCNGGEFEIPPLPPGRHYGGPNVGEANPCGCNTVTYSLVSACAACQGSSTWIQWTSWSTNCTTVAPPSTYPNPIPGDTRVPHWAYISMWWTSLLSQMVQTANNWSVAAAESAGDSPDAAPSGPSTTEPSSTASSSPNSKQRKSHAGETIGAIVVGAAGAALLTASIWYFRYRRRLAEPQSSSFDLSESNTMSLGKLYDPNDPSTFPMPFVAPSAVVTKTSSRADRANPMSSKDRSRYTGLPLV